MRARLPLLALLGATLVAPLGCKHTGDTAGGPKSSRPARVKLPDPLPLPDQPVAAAHVENPGAALAMVDPWVEESLAAAAVLERGLTQFTTAEVATQIAATIDPARTWSSVRLGDGEEIAHFSVLAQQSEQLAEILDGLAKEGRFGARRLPERPPVEETEEGPWSHKPHLAWLDPETGNLTIATSLPGLVTGAKISEAYGKAPLFVTADGSMMPEIVPLTRITAQGELSDLEVTATLDEGYDPAAELSLEAGALTGLLSGPDTVVGVTSRMAGHEEVVKTLIRNIDRMVDEQPFLLQGILQDMQKKFNAIARSWNGRFYVALGPPGHVRVAYGADDPKKSGVAVLRFTQTVIDNANLIRNFTSQVPSISLKKNVGEGAGEPIHRLSVSKAKSLLQAEAHALVDDKNKLRVAGAWSRHAGAGMVVVGPESTSVLQRWLEASSNAPAGEATTGDLGAAMVALSPEQAPALRNTQLDPSVLFGLTGDGPRRTIVAERVDERTIKLHVTGVPKRVRKGAPASTASP